VGSTGIRIAGLCIDFSRLTYEFFLNRGYHVTDSTSPQTMICSLRSNDKVKFVPDMDRGQIYGPLSLTPSYMHVTSRPLSPLNMYTKQ